MYTTFLLNILVHAVSSIALRLLVHCQLRCCWITISSSIDKSVCSHYHHIMFNVCGPIQSIFKDDYCFSGETRMPHQRLRQGTIALSLVFDYTTTEDDIRNTRVTFLMTCCQYIYAQTNSCNEQVVFQPIIVYCYL